jgi:hypothetical protein
VNNLSVEGCKVRIRGEVGNRLCMYHCHEANTTLAGGYASDRPSWLVICIMQKTIVVAYGSSRVVTNHCPQTICKEH